eukprot:TRINITY_DN18069_c0_g1_i1.p1 TRINITY_DN18069_c0_g1~~TRINITY_DN18069_c0_g1_i1.p1  ORF type:complete len:495 (-),score=175.78 TRINITY_DN18069_c0_g1_i1:91-1554(-)
MASTSTSAQSGALAAATPAAALAARPTNEAPPPVLVSNKDFDLKKYIARYRGFTRIHRLSFIVERCPDQADAAVEIALADFTKQSGGPVAAASAPVGEKVSLCTQLYKQVCEKIAAGRPGNPPPFDQAWFDATERFCVAQQEKLEKDLNAARSSTAREAIRAAHLALGDFFFRRGDFNTALKMYSRMRDQCTTPAQLNEMHMRLIRCSFEARTLSTVPGHVQKCLQTTDARDLPLLAKLKTAGALADLAMKSYKQAARKFLECPAELGSSFSEVIAPEDVAVYGGLCALATFDRGELKRLVLENQTFRQHLDAAPAVARVIGDFHRCEYGTCLRALDHLRADLLLDLHLHDHVTQLYQRIRDKALVQYCAPYAAVDLRPMAVAFGSDVAALEHELSKLIVEGQLSARIDAQRKVLVARSADQRRALFAQALEQGEELRDEVSAARLRLSLLRNDFCVRDGKRGGVSQMQQMQHMQQKEMLMDWAGYA